MTTASMSAQVMPASSRARMAASRTSPAMETSPRVAWWRVWPQPTTATRSAPISCLLRGRRPGSAAGTGRRWRGPRPGRHCPAEMRLATSTMRTRPAAMIGLAASGPPDGLTSTSSPEAERVPQDRPPGEVKGACSSATSTGPSPTPAASAARRVEGESVRSRTPRAWASMRCSMPRIQAGLSDSSRARSSAARTTATAPSLMRRAVVLAQRGRRAGPRPASRRRRSRR